MSSKNLEAFIWGLVGLVIGFILWMGAVTVSPIGDTVEVDGRWYVSVNYKSDNMVSGFDWYEFDPDAPVKFETTVVVTP